MYVLPQVKKLVSRARSTDDELHDEIVENDRLIAENDRLSAIVIGLGLLICIVFLGVTWG
jgi:hypothetical protein